MTFGDLSESYFWKARSRRKVLQVLFEDKNYSDVVREAQELVELALKGVLRALSIDPPRWHDVGPVLADNQELLPTDMQLDLPEILRISSVLRREREIAFYGDVDSIPTESYKEEDALRAMEYADKVLDFVKKSQKNSG